MPTVPTQMRLEPETLAQIDWLREHLAKTWAPRKATRTDAVRWAVLMTYSGAGGPPPPVRERKSKKSGR